MNSTSRVTVSGAIPKREISRSERVPEYLRGQIVERRWRRPGSKLTRLNGNGIGAKDLSVSAPADSMLQCSLWQTIASTRPSTEQ